MAYIGSSRNLHLRATSQFDHYETPSSTAASKGDPGTYSEFFYCKNYIYMFISRICIWTPTISPEVWRMDFWMKCYGHKTPKRSSMWSNSKNVFKFRTPKLKRSKKYTYSNLVKRYRNKEGKPRFVGNRKALKNSAIPG